MALSTTQYGYIIDPMVPFTDDKGKTIKNGFVRVFVAGSSTPVVTYRNFDGATNQDRIELDNSGRTKTSVIGSKGLTYKVCVYDKHHSQESPILTVDKVSVIGVNITAGAGATLVTGLDGLTTKPDGFVDASVVGTDGYVAIDHTLVTDDLDTDAKVTAVENDRYIPLLNDDVNDPDSKMTLGRLWKWVLGKIKSLPTTITSFRTGDVIPVDGPSGTAKMSKDSLLQETANNALGSIHNLATTATESDLVAGNFLAIDIPGVGGATKKVPGNLVAPKSVQDNLRNSIAPEFKTNLSYIAGEYVSYSGSMYMFLVPHAAGAWNAEEVVLVDARNIDPVKWISFVRTGDNSARVNIKLRQGQKIVIQVNDTSGSGSYKVVPAYLKTDGTYSYGDWTLVDGKYEGVYSVPWDCTLVRIEPVEAGISFTQNILLSIVDSLDFSALSKIRDIFNNLNENYLQETSTSLNFSTSTNYPKGTSVAYKGKIYKFTREHPAGAWIGTDVIEVRTTDLENSQWSTYVRTGEFSIIPRIKLIHGYRLLIEMFDTTTTEDYNVVLGIYYDDGTTSYPQVTISNGYGWYSDNVSKEGELRSIGVTSANYDKTQIINISTAQNGRGSLLWKLHEIETGLSGQNLTAKLQNPYWPSEVTNSAWGNKMLRGKFAVLVDDDGRPEGMERIHAACAAKGIKATFAITMQKLDQEYGEGTYLDLYKTYQEMGYDFANHSDTHARYWYHGDKFDIDEVYADLARSHRKFVASGLWSPNAAFVYPGSGGYYEKETRMAVMNLYELAFRAGHRSEPLHPIANNEPWCMDRYFLSPTDDPSMTSLEAYIDACHPVGQMPVISTHSYDAMFENNPNYISDAIQMIKDKGYTFVTLSQLVQILRPLKYMFMQYNWTL